MLQFKGAKNLTWARIRLPSIAHIVNMYGMFVITHVISILILYNFRHSKLFLNSRQC